MDRVRDYQTQIIAENNIIFFHKIFTKSFCDKNHINNTLKIQRTNSFMSVLISGIYGQNLINEGKY